MKNKLTYVLLGGVVILGALGYATGLGGVDMADPGRGGFILFHK